MRLDRPRSAFRTHGAATLSQFARIGCVWGSCLAFDVAAESPDTAAAPTKGDPPSVVDYSRHIRPILSNNCFKCHGPDEKERQGQLRLDLRDDALKPTASGATAIVPGKSDAS